MIILDFIVFNVRDGTDSFNYFSEFIFTNVIEESGKLLGFVKTYLQMLLRIQWK